MVRGWATGPFIQKYENAKRFIPIQNYSNTRGMEFVCVWKRIGTDLTWLPNRHTFVAQIDFQIQLMDSAKRGNMNEPNKRRTRLVRPYPIHKLEEAIVVAETIQKVNSGLPFDRGDLATAMGIKPSSSGFTMKLNSSAKYGLTQGGYSDYQIVLTARGEAVVAPNDSRERSGALIDAVLEPEVFKKFFGAMEGRQIPEDTYAKNLLQRELGISPALTDECLNLIKANAVFVGIASERNGALFVEQGHSYKEETDQIPSESHSGLQKSKLPNKIFIAHIGSSLAVDFIKRTLYRLGVEISVHEVDKEDAPIGQEASRSMRECVAALLVYGGTGYEADQQLTNAFNYLVGAVSVMYGSRVVVVRELGSDPDVITQGIRVLEFNPDSPDGLAVELLAELHAADILGIKIIPPRD